MTGSSGTWDGSAAVAVVAVGCILPDALSPDAFWRNTLRGHSALRPLEGPGWRRHHHPDPAAPDRSACLHGARVTEHALDWRKFRISPNAVRAMNPMARYVLDAGVQALEGVRRIPRETSGIFVGATSLGFRSDGGLAVRLGDLADAVRHSEAFARLPAGAQESILAQARRGLQDRLEPVSDDHAVNACASIAAGRIAMHFDLHGLHYAVDSGSASALAALDAGVRGLRDGTVDLALVGGASELLTPLSLLAWSKLGALATGPLSPFDSEARGTLLGEGAAFLALKRLEDAAADGESILAVVRGVGGATDTRVGSRRTAGPQTVTLAMRSAYQDAGVEPASVGFVECHAPGIPEVDMAEVRALAGLLAGASGPAVALGCAKPCVGHLGGGAGAVGLLRAVLALHHRTVPPQIHFQTAHPGLQLEATPLCVPRQARPLEPRAGTGPARAAVTALGLGGGAFHAVLEAHHPVPARRQRRPASEPVAVVGLGAALPGADGVPAFWRSLLEGRDATREVPPERWQVDRYFDPDPQRLETTYSRLGCFLETFPEPPRHWRIPAAAGAAIDPGQLVALAAAEEAVADAGLAGRPWDRERTAVILGFLPVQGRRYLADARVAWREFEAELERALGEAGVAAEAAREVVAEAEGRFKAGLPALTPYTLSGLLGGMTAARIAQVFGFAGRHATVDSACSSTLAAVQTAVQGLRHGLYDTALAGGAWADIQPEFLVAMSRFRGLSPTGITPFAAGANGFVTGEGAGVLVLQRLPDAERQGRRIHAVIRAVAGSSDGRGRSIFAPSAEGEALAMQRAREQAGLADGDDLGYLECHGTGTAVGDVVEIDACLRAQGRGRPSALRVGSVKSNLGHLMGAAGAPALIKAILAVRDGLIPPSLKAREPNPRIDFAVGPVAVVTETSPWPQPAGSPRRAGVNSFGLGGTNFHAIVEQYLPPAAPAARARRAAIRTVPVPEPLPIAAAAGGDLRECADRLGSLSRQLAGAAGSRYLDALARTQEAVAGEGGWRLAVVASRPDHLARRHQALAQALALGADPVLLAQQGVFAARPDAAEPVAFLFPGQGGQYPNMLREARTAFPEIAEALDAADAAYQEIAGRPLTPSFFTDRPGEHVQSDEDVHCAVFAVSTAVFSLFQRRGVRPHSLMGQSAGELAAMVAGGVLPFEEGLAAIRERTLSVLALETADPGAMVALGCGAEEAQGLLDGLPGYAALAADNGPAACIVSGDRRATQALLALAASRHVESEVLPVSHGYHSRLIAGARPRYRAALDGLPFRPAAVEIVSTITGRSIGDLPAERHADHLASQFVEPVRLREAVEALHRGGARLFLECGPKWPLTTFVGTILGGRPHVAQASLHPKVGEVEQLARAFACLFAHRAIALSPPRSQPMPLPTEPAFDLRQASQADPPRPEAAAATSPPSPISAPAAVPPLAAARAAPEGPAWADFLALLQGIHGALDAFLRNVNGSATAPAPETGTTQARAAESGEPSGGRPHPPRPDRDQVRRLIVGETARRTGYPEEMLELDLDLEGELGIDTVKQVAVLAAVRQALGLALDPALRLRDLNTLGKTVDYVVRRLEGHAFEPTSPAPPAPLPPAPSLSAPSLSAPSLSAAATAAGGQDARRGVIPSAPAPDREGVRRLLVEEMARRTGYPEEMLELDLDLEGELGIDTVKQVAVLAAVRQKLGLALDPTLRLRDLNTLGKAIEYVVRRLATSPPGAGRATPAGAPASEAPGAPEAAAPAAPAGELTSQAGPSARRQAPPVGGQILSSEVRAALGSLLATAWETVPAGVAWISDLTLNPPYPGLSGGSPEMVVTPAPGGATRVAVRSRAAAIQGTFASGPGSPAPPGVAAPEVVAAAAEPSGENGGALRQLLGLDGAGAAARLRWVRPAGSSAVAAEAVLGGGGSAPRRCWPRSSNAPAISPPWAGTGSPARAIAWPGSNACASSGSRPRARRSGSTPACSLPRVAAGAPRPSPSRPTGSSSPSSTDWTGWSSSRSRAPTPPRRTTRAGARSAWRWNGPT